MSALTVWEPTPGDQWIVLSISGWWIAALLLTLAGLVWLKGTRNRWAGALWVLVGTNYLAIGLVQYSAFGWNLSRYLDSGSDLTPLRLLLLILPAGVMAAGVTMWRRSASHDGQTG